MEEATGAPSSFAVYDPRRLRASGRDGGGVMSRPPSPLTMLLLRHTRRREFIAGLGVAGWPLLVRAQPQTDAVLGYLRLAPGRPEATEGFRRGLAEVGFSEGRDLTVEYHTADGHAERLPALAADLVLRRPAAILANSIAGALAAKAATQDIPIIFSVGSDPVE